jgi:hypothetical protein
MVNHPNRSAASFRFIGFDMVTGQSIAHADTARGALALATECLPNADFIEVIDCGENGRTVWYGGVGETASNPAPLCKARTRYATVFRGVGDIESPCQP